MVDASKMTDKQLLVYIHKFLDEAYKEIEGNINMLNEDFLTTGVVRFNQRLGDVSALDFRMLSQLMEARRLEITVKDLAKGKAKLASQHVVDFLIQQPRPDVFKYMDASERKAYAQAQCAEYFQDADVWSTAASEIKVFIENMDDKRSSLKDGQQRLLASLWAVKVHGILGELQKQAPGVSDPGQTMMHSVVQDKIPEFQSGNVHIPLTQKQVTGDDSELDDLLGSKGA